MNLVLIGPVYPYKGGISHYTSLLCKELRKNHDVTMVSYKMQYPKILFKKEQKDYSNNSFQIENTNYWINTANPFNIINCANKINRLKPDAIIIQWWHPYFAPCYFILSLFLKNIPIIFTCHNVFPHERFPMDKFLTKMVLKKGTGYIVQSHSDEKDLLSIKPSARYVVTPHPTYNAFKMSGIAKCDAQLELGITKGTPNILFFGFVREYKGLKYLLYAMPEIISQIPDIQLWVVGDFDNTKQEYIDIINEFNISSNIKLIEGYIPDDEVEKYFASTDLVVLPYTSATQSGIVQIAYGFEKPVVVTNVGGLPDVVEDGKTGYIINKENPSEITDAIVKFYEKNDESYWIQNIREASETFSWKNMVERICSLI